MFAFSDFSLYSYNPTGCGWILPLIIAKEKCIIVKDNVKILTIH